MPGTPGTVLLEEARVKYPSQSRIILSAYNEMETIFDAINKCLIFRYISKPWDEMKLKNLIDEAYEFYLLNRTKEILYLKWLETENQIDLLNKLKESKTKL